MKMKEIKGSSPEELKKNVLTLKKELFNLRFQKISGQIENPARFSKIRKDIARSKTLLNALENNAKLK